MLSRKEFLKRTALGVTGGMLVPILSCSDKKTVTEQMTLQERTNWAGNYVYKAENLHEPASLDELQELVKSLDNQKALGSTHCFNNIADSDKNQISTRKLQSIVSLDKTNRTITVEAGVRYGDFAQMLHNEGFALHNLASLPHITVAGACATATHGSGTTNGNLATSVVSVELVKPDGSVVKINRILSPFIPPGNKKLKK